MINSEMQNVCIENMKDIIRNYGKNVDLIQIPNEKVEKTFHEICDIRIKPNVMLSGTVKDILYNLEKYRPEVRKVFEHKIFDLLDTTLKPLDEDQPLNIEPELFPSEGEQLPKVEEKVDAPLSVEEAVIEVAEQDEEHSSLEEAVIEVAEKDEEQSYLEEAVLEVVENDEKQSSEEAVIEVAEIVEEPAAIKETEVDDTAGGSISEPLEKEPEIKLFEGDEQQVAKKKEESLEAYPGQADETEISYKKRQRDWFDLLLDISAAVTKFFMRILFRKRSN